MFHRVFDLMNSKLKVILRGIVLAIAVGLFQWNPSVAQGQIEDAFLKPYIFFNFSRDVPEDHNYGAFHYTNVHVTLPPELIYDRYQSGLFHTWYRPSKIYGDKKNYDRQRDGYHAMEGGAGYKPYLRFHSESAPFKFTTGAVAGGFGSFSNVPGQGVPAFKRSKGSRSNGWERNVGRYGAAQLSNRLMFPLDGIGFKEGTNNQMIGYGYFALPLTEPKSSTAGSNAPTGNHCWTLFLNSEDFAGPVCFFTPYHWSKYSIGKPHLHGRCFDSSPMAVNATYQRETNKIPGKKWTAPNGDVYYRVAPYYMAANEDFVGEYGTMLMAFDSKKWDLMESWFQGGEPVPGTFDEDSIHVRNINDVRLAYSFDKVNVRMSSFANSVKSDTDENAATVKWNRKLAKPVEGLEAVQIPEYYRQKAETKLIVAIAEKDVPKRSGLQRVEFPGGLDDFKAIDYDTSPIVTPFHPNYRYTDEIVDKWKTPGPVAGPFSTELDDGSVVVYYWYKFCEQPAILNSDMDEEERQLCQKRVELVHSNWGKDDEFFPAPPQPLATLDPGLLVTPPQGLEVGYVPICVHQQSAEDKLPKFKKINRR
jgi:hypothetical protein